MLQGSLGPVVSVTQSTKLDASLDLTQVSKLSVFGETRELYLSSKTSRRSNSADVFYHSAATAVDGFKCICRSV